MLPTGVVACLGNGSDLSFFNPDTQEWRDPGGAGEIPHTQGDLAVPLAPAQAAKILHNGGAAGENGNLGIVTAQIINLSVPDLAWREIAPMANPQWFLNSVLLPEGTLFVVGGGRVQTRIR